MKTSDFYDIIDKELDVLLERYKDNDFVQKHQKNPNNQKSYAFLMWFVNFYGKAVNYTDYITEGSNDSSCDIVFDWNDNQGKKIFYIVQSKWNNARKAEAEVERDEILKALSEFETIVSGEKGKINDKLHERLKLLLEHLRNNGEVKFIFLSLAQYKGGADDNIRTFLKKDDKRSAEIIDINRIKHDYIDRNYKEIKPINPLERYYNPQESIVNIKIAESGNFVKINNPFPAYNTLLRPKMIYELFDKYGFALFYKNVRNPLLESQFNEQIEQTVINNPAFFWYYNNGITAITSILPTIGQQAETIQIKGLQIINGAQTVYAIYRAYKNASNLEREQMNNEALVSFRLLKSGGKDFDLNVTRYTNSQNPVKDSDFFANDDIQIALQNASYETPIWYQKRRSEFRKLPENIREISNDILADFYLAFHLQNPADVCRKLLQQTVNGHNLSFIARNGNRNGNNKQGLYEKIFNENTTYEDMLSAFYVADTILQEARKSINNVSFGFFLWLSLSKIILTRFFQKKYSVNINTTRRIIQLYEEEGNKELILKVVGWIIHTHATDPESNQEIVPAIPHEVFITPPLFELIKENFENIEFSVDDIENTSLEDAKFSIRMIGHRRKYMTEMT